jgi:hypothetical protein
MTLDILRKTGGWCVELQQPLKHGPKHEINQIEIRPCTADHMIRWAQEKIPSTLALLSELSDVPERLLRQLPSHDFDRVMLALAHLLPNIIKKDWEEGNRPIATPDEELPAHEAYVPAPDQVDPRYPSAQGPVVRMPPGPIMAPPKPTPEEMGDGSGLNMAIPPTVNPVH